jgi:tetratricopeptide (TPR) repeat protein
MITPRLHPIYVFGTGLLLWTSIGVPPQAAAIGALIATDGPVLLAQASGQSSSPYPAEVQEWQRQVKSLQQQGKYLEAAQIQEKKLAWTAQHLGPNHPDTATSLNNLAFLYDSQGAYAKAEPLYLRALAIREKALGPDNPDTADSLNNLAVLYSSQGAYAKAKPLFLRALAIREKALGSNHPMTINVRENLSSVPWSGVTQEEQPRRSRG